MGGIVNRVAGKGEDGSGIRYEPNYRWFDYESDRPDDWRRLAQWLPHSTWFLFGAAAGSKGVTR